MGEKKSPQTKGSSLELNRTYHEILVADKRSYEPFVKVFRAVGENISKLDLGTLVGVFEVDERSEEAAYIVNFLASVAKKEYFNNPRRGPIESFEAALHKVNVALAELVKHGNVSWLGKLHGALAVIEKNNLHFSVTGEAALLLWRQDQFSEISAGLASSEAAIHPLKTFVEVSSGRILSEDLLLFTTPELPALLPLEYLAKQALRMKRDAFRQFLRTALVNEIDMAAVLAIEFDEKTIEPKAAPKKKLEPAKKSPEALNAFSQATFTKETKPKTLPETEATLLEEEKETKEEFIDEKTGHIYVQGEDFDTLPSKHSAALEALQDISTSLGDFFSRTLRRQSKKTARLSAFVFWEMRSGLSRWARKGGHQVNEWQAALAAKKKSWKETRQEQERIKQAALAERQKAQAVALSPVPHQQPETNKTLHSATTLPKKKLLPITPIDSSRSLHPSQTTKAPLETNHLTRFRALYHKETSPTGKSSVPPTKPQKNSQPLPFPKIDFNFSSLARILSSLKDLCLSNIRALLQFIQTRKMLFVGILGIIFFSLIVGYWLLKNSPEEKSAIINTPPPSTTETPSPTTEPDSSQLHPESSFSLHQELVAVSYLDHLGYAATSKSIIALEDNSEYPIPNLKGEIRFMVPMEDLRLIFLMSSQNELFAWSPLNKAFTSNTITLPENSRVTALSTYLTYLYVLDRDNNQLYRYPRSEDGFKDATPWMKDSFEITDTALLAINETIALSPSREHILSFTQGKNTGAFVESNETKQVTIQALGSNSDFPFIYAIDDQKNLMIWNLERKLLHTYRLNLAEAPISLAVDPEKKALLVGAKGGTITRYTNVQSE